LFLLGIWSPNSGRHREAPSLAIIVLNTAPEQRNILGFLESVLYVIPEG